MRAAAARKVGLAQILPLAVRQKLRHQRTGLHRSSSTRSAAEAVEPHRRVNPRLQGVVGIQYGLLPDDLFEAKDPQAANRFQDGGHLLHVPGHPEVHPGVVLFDCVAQADTNAVVGVRLPEHRNSVAGRQADRVRAHQAVYPSGQQRFRLQALAES